MRIVIFIYGMVSYALGTASLLYLIGFLGNIVVPKSIDSPPEGVGGHFQLQVGVFAAGGGDDGF